jgi:hypothetical protein
MPWEVAMELVLGLGLGLGLAAACGFRVFVPMFIMSVAAKAGFLELNEQFTWMASWPAVVAFGTATLFETAAYYVPWVDNLLDSVATPAAVVAGIVATAASVAEADPLLQWSAALIGGGGVAGAVQSSSVVLRAASTVATGGLGNFVVATIEWMGALLLSIVSLLIPLLAGAAAIGLLAAAVSLLLRGGPPSPVAGSVGSDRATTTTADEPRV